MIGAYREWANRDGGWKGFGKAELALGASAFAGAMGYGVVHGATRGFLDAGTGQVGRSMLREAASNGALGLAVGAGIFGAGSMLVAAGAGAAAVTGADSEVSAGVTGGIVGAVLAAGVSTAATLVTLGRGGALRPINGELVQNVAMIAGSLGVLGGVLGMWGGTSIHGNGD